MLISTEVELTWTNNRKIYEPKGYKYTKQGNKFKVKIEDLALNSHVEIEVRCDYCGKQYSKPYSQFNRREYKKIINKDACEDCRLIKTSESNIIVHGVAVHNQCKNPFDKVKNEFALRGYDLLPYDNIITNKTKLNYVCRTHPNEIRTIVYKDFKNNQGCKECGIEKQRLSITTPIEKITSDFSLRGYKVIGEFYYNNRRYIKYICLNHISNGEQKIDYASFNQGHGCKYCFYDKVKGENHPSWKGGITPLHSHLRTRILQWKKDSINYCNNKCVITGESSSTVHHIFGFDLILAELINELSLNDVDFNNILTNNISLTRLKLIEDKCLELHYKHGLGVCLSESIHKLFHSLYGYGHNTPEQFEEFKQRYNNGEFDLLLSAK